MKRKIALIYDRANTAYGGAERVLLALKAIYPKATLFTSVYDQKKAKWLKDFEVKASFLQRIPFAKNLHRYLAALMPLAFEGLDLSEYEIIISITSAEAKGVVTRRDQLHFCYLLSPPRYLYHYQSEYLSKTPILNLPIIKQLAKAALSYLKKWDQTAIYRPDLIVPISKVVKNRTEKYYQNLDIKQIIYPPVDEKLLYLKGNNSKPDGEYFLIVSRLVPYKHLAPAIEACIQLQKKLIIVGNGPDKALLKKLAKQNKNIIFKDKASEQELSELYQNCLAVLSPGLDDFGISALEANLFGKAVIINQLAGAAEIIEDGKHGVHIKYSEHDNDQTISKNLVAAIKKFEKTRFDAEELSKNALKYGTNKFAFNFDQALQKAYNEKLEGKL